MKKLNPWGIALVAVSAAVILYPDLVFAQFAGGDLQSKVNGVTSGLITFLLPAASTIGLIYAAILAASGDAGARQRMTLIAVTSVLGMLAPLIIRWLQSMAS